MLTPQEVQGRIDATQTGVVKMLFKRVDNAISTAATLEIQVAVDRAPTKSTISLLNIQLAAHGWHAALGSLPKNEHALLIKPLESGIDRDHWHHLSD